LSTRHAATYAACSFVTVSSACTAAGTDTRSNRHSFCTPDCLLVRRTVCTTANRHYVHDIMNVKVLIPAIMETVFERGKKKNRNALSPNAEGARSFNAARVSGERCKLPQRVRAEPGRQATFGAFLV